VLKETLAGFQLLQKTRDLNPATFNCLASIALVLPEEKATDSLQKKDAGQHDQLTSFPDLFVRNGVFLFFHPPHEASDDLPTKSDLVNKKGRRGRYPSELCPPTQFRVLTAPLVELRAGPWRPITPWVGTTILKKVLFTAPFAVPFTYIVVPP